MGYTLEKIEKFLTDGNFDRRKIIETIPIKKIEVSQEIRDFIIRNHRPYYSATRDIVFYIIENEGIELVVNNQKEILKERKFTWDYHFMKIHYMTKVLTTDTKNLQSHFCLLQRGILRTFLFGIHVKTKKLNLKVR